MIQQTRLKRPTLERTGPVRNIGKAFSQHGDFATSDTRAQTSANDEESGIQDAVSEGVRLGYSVIEDQIRQAQGLAKKFSPGTANLGMGGDEIRPLLSRMLRTYGDLTSVWLEVLNAAVGNAELLDALLGKSKDDQKPTSKDQSENRSTTDKPAMDFSGISLSLIANCPVETKLDLFDSSGDASSLVVQDLRCRENGKPPLSNIVMQQANQSGSGHLTIKVPDEQPPGLYQGLILDSLTDSPVGALSVTVHPR